MQRIQQFHQKATKLSYQFYPTCVVSNFNKAVSDAAHIIPYQLCQEAGHEELAYDSRNLITLAKHLHVGFEIANGKIPNFTFKIIDKNKDYIKTQVRLPPFSKDSTLPEFLYDGKEVLLREESLPYLITHNIIFNHSWGIKSEQYQLDLSNPINKKLNTIIEYFKKKMGDKYNHYDTDKLEHHLSEKIEKSRKKYVPKNARIQIGRTVQTGRTRQTNQQRQLENIEKVMKVKNNIDKHKLKTKSKKFGYVMEVSGKRNMKGKTEYRILWHDRKNRSWTPANNIPKDIIKRYEEFIEEDDDEYSDIQSEETEETTTENIDYYAENEMDDDGYQIKKNDDEYLPSETEETAELNFSFNLDE